MYQEQYWSKEFLIITKSLLDRWCFFLRESVVAEVLSNNSGSYCQIIIVRVIHNSVMALPPPVRLARFGDRFA
jgi:hypothetical protein